MVGMSMSTAKGKSPYVTCMEGPANHGFVDLLPGGFNDDARSPEAGDDGRGIPLVVDSVTSSACADTEAERRPSRRRRARDSPDCDIANRHGACTADRVGDYYEYLLSVLSVTHNGFYV